MGWLEVADELCPFLQQFDDQKLQTFTSCLFLAGLVASFPAAWVTTKKGRKVSMVRHCVPVYDIF